MIMSVVIEMPGLALRRAVTISRNRSTVYGRFIRLRTVFEPDWIGRWMCGIRVLSFAYDSMSSGETSFGCGDVNLSLRRPFAWSLSRVSKSWTNGGAWVPASILS